MLRARDEMDSRSSVLWGCWGSMDWEEWCDRTRPRVPVHLRAGPDRERAEDLTQETYARVLRASSPSETKSEAYLRAVALNLVRDEWRRDKARGIQCRLSPEGLESSSKTPTSLSWQTRN